MAIKRFNDLIVWQKAIDFVEAVYRATADFPKAEVCGLTSQLRRAAVSIPSNIAEGQSRHTTRDFLNFLSIARGSLAETETQVIIAERLKYIESELRSALLTSIAELGRLLNGLSNSFTRPSATSH